MFTKPKCFLLWLLLVCLRSSVAGLPQHELLWDTEAAPVLDRYCFKCHAGVRQKSGLDLRSLDTILRGGERGPAIIPGMPEESRLLTFLSPTADPHMPPEGKKQLTATEIAALRLWISKLPVAPKVSTNSADTSWVPGYLAELRASFKPNSVPEQGSHPSAAIDQILAADWQDQGITPAAASDDRTFVRRVYLDLAGRIPTPVETGTFLTSAAGDRREELIEQLLESPEYAKHFRDVFDVILLGRPKGRNDAGRKSNGWSAYLENAFGANRPWNAVVRELILARGTSEMTRGASQFLYERRNNHQAMAEAVAPVAYGVQIGCAQCHNHPLSWEIEQRHYWGLVAAFNRSKNVETSAGIGVSESAIGGFVQFTNLKKESQPAVLAFLNGKTVQEHRPEQNEKETDIAELYAVAPPKDGEKPKAAAVPKFSRREALAEAVTHDNARLSRAFVNRIWQLLLGRGLVHPVDQMDSRHRPSHPELLDWLATDFERSGYDIKRLVRSVASSRAYQLESNTLGRTPPPVTSFARALDKPLSAEQLAASLFVATGCTDATEEQKEELRRALVQKMPDLMPTVYNPSLDLALFWANSPLVQSLITPKGNNTAARLLTRTTPEDRISQAYLLVLGRYPDPQEIDTMKGLGVATGSESGIKNLLWALLSSAEFQLNH